MTSSTTDWSVYLARLGLREFRPGQREVLEAVLGGEHCLCIMPTGGGKSLCYQLPSLIRPGVTLVVSPLIALMKDQVDHLSRLGISATCINSTLDYAEQQERLRGLQEGRYELVYVAPERFRSPAFCEVVRHSRLQLLAVDEAHCISEWGHDFRLDYSRLGHFRRQLGNPQTIALTATATEDVRRDIVRQLGLEQFQTFVAGFARPNLFYEVQRVGGRKEKHTALLEYLRMVEGVGIIYTATRKQCDETSSFLNEELGERVVAYHGGMTSEERHQAQELFMNDEARVVVATNAFGMGIDKPDVRFVVHFNMPGTLEAYYQEAGRAGRDGLKSRCLMLLSGSDRYVQEFFIENNYPSPQVIRQVYEYLRRRPEDPIELTQDQLKEALGLSIGAEGVGTCERLLEKAGALQRLEPNRNMAAVRIDSDLPTLVELLPPQAKSQRAVMRAVERIVGQRRYELVFLRPQLLADQTQLDLAGVTRALRELQRLEGFDYIPPFRGRAVHMPRKDIPFSELNLSLNELDERRKFAWSKLEQVVTFGKAQRRCRQRILLEYFGDTSATNCGHCDNCQAGRVSGRVGAVAPTETALRSPVVAAVAGAAINEVAPAASAAEEANSESAQGSFLHSDRDGSTLPVRPPHAPASLAPITAAAAGREVGGVTAPSSAHVHGPHSGAPSNHQRLDVHELAQKVLSGVVRCRRKGRFGKQVVVGMLCGSRSAKMAKWKFDELSTFGLLKEWRQSDVSDMVDTLVEGGLVEAVDVDKFRPVLEITATGREVMLGRLPLEPELEDHLQELLSKRANIGPGHPSRMSSWGVSRPGEAPEPNEDRSRSPRGGSAEEGAGRPLRRDGGAENVNFEVPGNHLGAAHPHPTGKNSYWTWKLLQDGYSVEACAEIRRSDRRQVVAELIEACGEGLPVKPAWLFNAQQRDELERWLSLPDGDAGDVKPLPSGYSAEDVQLYRLCRNSPVLTNPPRQGIEFSGDVG